MESLTAWELSENDFMPTIQFTQQIVKAHFGDAVVVEHCGYTFDKPGICLELLHITSFNDDDINFLKSNLLNFGANMVHIGYEMETGVITIEIYILKNATNNLNINKGKSQNCTPKYSLCYKTINIVKSPYYRLALTSIVLGYRLFLQV